MKIAFLCKRRYTGKDVITDRFGRLYELPLQLALLGHEVRGYCLDYHQAGSGAWRHEVTTGALRWESRSLGALRLPAMLGYPWHLLRRLRGFPPDLLIGASDIPHVAMTAWLARRLGIPFAIDLYDNFESFSLARVPGFVTAYRRAIRRAGLITAVSEPLQRKVQQEYRASGSVRVMTNAIDRYMFRRFERSEARSHLNLPIEARLVGTAGGLQRSKGVGTLYAAWEQLRAMRPDIHLVLAGPTDNGFPPPRGDRVHYLGQLPQARVAELFSALDVGVVTLADTAFGRYCFPQKLHEMLACGLPVVAADVGVMSVLLRGSPGLLYPHGDSAALVAAVLRQLDAPSMPELPVPDWAQLVADIEPDLRTLALAPQDRGAPR
jgi:teichuronic acid biosynthesis glycosyltransferase TuaC